MTKFAPGAGRRILLVDEDALALRSLARILRREFEVVTATDAADAIAKVVDDLYAVVTDHDLGPAGNGRAVLAEVRRRVPNAKRMLISGRPQKPPVSDRDLWHTLLQKPVSHTELFAALRLPSSE